MLDKAKSGGGSDSRLCAIGTHANKTRIYKPDEMDADHVTAWSKGCNTDLKNCLPQGTNHSTRSQRTRLTRRADRELVSPEITGDIWSTQVKEPTELNGTPRYSYSSRQ